MSHAASISHTSDDQLTHDLLIRFCAAFLDQGYANWRLPHREQGFFRAFATLYSQPFGPPDRWLRGLRCELTRLDAAGLGPLDSIVESLRLLGVADEEQEAYLQATLQALPGWAGMIWQMETNAEWTLLPAPPGTLIEFLAIRLILDRLAAAYVARDSLGWRGDLCDLRDELRDRIPEMEKRGVEQYAVVWFHNRVSDRAITRRKRSSRVAQSHRPVRRRPRPRAFLLSPMYSQNYRETDSCPSPSPHRTRPQMAKNLLATSLAS